MYFAYQNIEKKPNQRFCVSGTGSEHQLSQGKWFSWCMRSYNFSDLRSCIMIILLKWQNQQPFPCLIIVIIRGLLNLFIPQIWEVIDVPTTTQREDFDVLVSCCINRVLQPYVKESRWRRIPETDGRSNYNKDNVIHAVLLSTSFWLDVVLPKMLKRLYDFVYVRGSSSKSQEFVSHCSIPAWHKRHRHRLVWARSGELICTYEMAFANEIPKLAALV